MNYEKMSREQLIRELDSLRSGDMFHILAETMATPIFIFQGTKMEYVNSAALELTEYSEEELLSRNFWEIIHPDFRELVKERGMARQQYEEVPSRYELKIITKFGKERWLHYSGSAFEYRGKPAVLGTVVDITERLQMEERIRQAKLRYRLLYEDIPSMYFTLRPDGSVISVNKFGASELGYAVEELVGQSVLKVFQKKDAPTVLNQLKICMQEPYELHEWQIQKIRKDGTLLWVEEFARKVDDPDGAPNILIVCQDITRRKLAEDALQEAKENLEKRVEERTAELINANIFLQREISERKQIEEALRESRERLQTLMEKIPNGVGVISPEGRLIYGNPALSNMFEYTEAELKKMETSGVIHPEEQKRLLEKIQHLFEGGSEYISEYRGLTKTGKIIPIEISSRRIIYDGKPVILSVLKDITERKKAEEQLKKERDRAQRYLDIAGVVFIVINADQTVKLINKKGCEILEYAESEIVGKNWFDHFVPERYQTKVRTGFNRLMKGDVKSMEYFENPVLTKSGAEKIIAWHNTVLSDENNQTIGTLSSGEDITKRKLVEEELNRHRVHLEELVAQRTANLKTANQKLRKEIQVRKRTEKELKESGEQLRKLSAYIQTTRDEERARIAREIHDELGQALSILQLDLNWLEMNLEENKAAVLEKIHHMTSFTGKIMKDVQRISRELRPGVLEHLGFAEALAWQAQDFTRRTGVQCDFLKKTKDIKLTDKQSNSLFRVLQETLTNVIRHAKAQKVVITLAENNGEIKLTIRDDGIGIPRDKINNPNSLGLIGIRERMLPLGGKMSITGKPNKGTVIRVTVPIKKKGGNSNEGSARG